MQRKLRKLHLGGEGVFAPLYPPLDPPLKEQHNVQKATCVISARATDALPEPGCHIFSVE